MNADCDVLVIGGGPAGSTAAALLAERGRDVVLLEREAHPRFHIGESLLPRNLDLLRRLGLDEEIAALGVYKPGAEFVDEDGREVQFSFSHSLDRRFTYSYQVERAPFDAALFANAGRRGARTAENMRVTDVTFGGPRASVTAEGPDGTTHHFAPRYVLDASGRDTFMAARLKTRQANKANSTAAAFAHYRGAERRDGDREGYISVHLAKDGWFWMIPLPDDVMSVGFVGDQSVWRDRRGDLTAFLDGRILATPSVRARMQGAERIGEVQGTGNYSYCADQAWGDGFFMIGDSFGFLDPVFSSGVLLAMTAAELGVDVACKWLDNPEAGRAAARRAEKQIRTGMRNLSWLVYRINDPVLRDLFMQPRNTLRMRDGIVTLLAGNLTLNWRSRGPILALKAVYHTVRLARRLGLSEFGRPAAISGISTKARDGMAAASVP